MISIIRFPSYNPYFRVYVYDENLTPLGFINTYYKVSKEIDGIFSETHPDCILTQFPSNYYFALWIFSGTGTMTTDRVNNCYRICTLP